MQPQSAFFSWILFNFSVFTISHPLYQLFSLTCNLYKPLRNSGIQSMLGVDSFKSMQNEKILLQHVLSRTSCYKATNASDRKQNPFVYIVHLDALNVTDLKFNLKLIVPESSAFITMHKYIQSIAYFILELSVYLWIISNGIFTCSLSLRTSSLSAALNNSKTKIKMIFNYINEPLIHELNRF